MDMVFSPNRSIGSSLLPSFESGFSVTYSSRGMEGP